MYKAKLILEKNNIKEVEDWGCGNCVFKEYLKNIKYTGRDGSETGYQDKIADLVTYKSNVECVFIRHILEHNSDYKKIFQNALDSFNKILILILFTPFSDEKTKVLTTWDLDGHIIPDISFNKKEITNIIEKNNCSYELIENISTLTQYKIEHIFIIKHL